MKHVLIALLMVVAVGPAAHAQEVAATSTKTLGSETASQSFVSHGLQSTSRKDGLALRGDIYIDTGYEQSNRALASENDVEYWLQEGRFMLQVTPTATAGDYFFKANAQFLAHVNEIRGNEYIDTDDAWVKFGKWDLWDVQVGRYEAWEVYHKGQGLERDTLEDLGAFDGADIYEVNYAYYRQDGYGQAAFHYYPSEWLRFEVGSVFGNEVAHNSIGVRPAAILDLSWFKFKVAAEWRKRQHKEAELSKFSEKKYGLGGSLQFFFDEPGSALPIQFGINGAYGLIDFIKDNGQVDEKASTDTLSVGGFVNVGLGSASLGLGYNHTIQGDRQKNDQTDKTGHFVHQQVFASIKHPVIVDRATVKLVFAYARAELQPSYDNHRINDMYSVRLRLLYQF
jgi:hypothetical protein